MHLMPTSINDRDKELIADEISDFIFSQLNFPEHTRFAYSVINKRHFETPVIYSNYPQEWIEKYIRMTLYKHDPVILIATKRIMPFPWSDNAQSFDQKEGNDIFSSSKKYNISSGYTFPLHDHENNLATLSLYIEDDGGLLQQCVDEHKTNMQLLLLSIHEKYLLARVQYYKEQRKIIEKRLTAREIEALRWASIGKTYSEIAIIMGITESTVKFHIGNLIVKLDVVNAKHAIKKASDLRLFTAYE